LRIRAVKPDYWNDAKLHNTPGITADVREFYIGTWGLADDTGWLRWDVQEIAKQLYGYRPVRRREANVTEWGQRLTVLGRLILMDCGHAHLPTLTRHQRMGGNRTDGIWREHQKCNPSIQVRTNLDEYGSSPMVSKVREGEVKEGKGRDSHLEIVDGAYKVKP